MQSLAFTTKNTQGAQGCEGLQEGWLQGLAGGPGLERWASKSFPGQKDLGGTKESGGD